MIIRFFVTLNRLLLFPVLALALIGLFFSIKNKNNTNTRLLCIFFLYSIIWRAPINSVLYSSRYSSSLFLPACFFSTFACYKLNRICKNDKPNTLLPGTILYCALVIVLLCSSLDFNHYEAFPIIAKDYYDSLANNINHFYTFSEDQRESYYLGKTVFNVNSNLTTEDNLIYQAQICKNIPENNGFFLYHKGNENYIPAIQPSITVGHYDKVFSIFTSSKKNKSYCLYRFIPSCSNLFNVSSSFEENSKSFDHSLIFDFENSNLTFDKLSLSDEWKSYYKFKNLLYPMNWYSNLGKAPSNSAPAFYVTDRTPISGNYSLYANSNGNNRFWFHSPPVKSGAYLVSFIANNPLNSPSILEVTVLTTTKSGLHYDNYKLKVNPSKPILFKTTIDTTINQNVYHVYLDFHLTGCVLIDDLLFEPSFD